MTAKKEIAVMAMLLLEGEDKKDINDGKRIWSRPRLSERNKKGHYIKLLPDLAAHDTEGIG